MQVIPYTAAHLDEPIWDSSEEFERMHPRLLWHLHTPYARTWCVERYEEVLAIGGAIRFGDQARISICKLVSGYDAEAIRFLLIPTLLQDLRADGCTGITTTVPPELRSIWEALGFTAQEQLLHYSGGRFHEPSYPDVVWMEPHHRMAVMHLDRQASGTDRRTLLLEHDYLGRAYLDGGTVRGFALALLGHALIVADAPHVGLELQRCILTTQGHLLVPEGNAAAHEHLLERGYTATCVGLRMVQGSVPPQRSAQIYAEPFGAV